MSDRIQIFRYETYILTASIEVSRSTTTINHESNATHRGEDGDEVALGALVIEGPIDGDLALMRQIDAEVTVAVGRGDALPADAVAVADAAAVARADRVLDEAVDAGVGVGCHHVLEDRRAHWCQLRRIEGAITFGGVNLAVCWKVILWETNRFGNA